MRALLPDVFVHRRLIGEVSMAKSTFNAWDVEYLQFTVREPYPSRTMGASIVFGRIGADRPMRITSYMPENGVIFSDGVENDFLEFRSGAIAEIAVAEKKGRLVL
ncbi:MAG: hypothetical protein FWD67_03950 [Betaproteobacteria bacterium]|nr:hypothetical protein [Betaproteobacteria bacterium]